MAVESVVPVIAAICSMAQIVSSPMVPAAAQATSLASMMLISLGDNLLQDPEWLAKVQDLIHCLEISAKRWKIAGELTLCLC